MNPQIKNAIHHAVVRTDLTGANVVGFVLCFKLADGTYAFNAQGVTPQEYVESAKRIESNKGEIHMDKPLGG